jgi:hypothetical protein
MKRQFTIWLLVILLISLSLGGFSGGIPMLMDPAQGGYLQFGDMLDQLPVSNFILPGLFLFFFMGIFPLVLVYGLIARPAWPWLDRYFTWSKHHWSWLGTIGLVIGLAIWLFVEWLMVGWWPITTITAVQGLLVLVVAVLPNLRSFLANKEQK